MNFSGVKRSDSGASVNFLYDKDRLYFRLLSSESIKFNRPQVQQDVQPHVMLFPHVFSRFD
ncbi:Uncharacterised protein [Vibrio cholerae]|uniref:Uncharacterized protein n=1 Tax=Vibrio cholerae TaxID=666 RepID=A0A655Y7P3_VIBCL|nr:Uncharacterised protein [Vibrio cholerae]CSA97785.1 Uncharacterised protein [Vibrio cholerae]CSC32462.1 Uncharacterised protein [Vibrio cholerae]CSC69385.1 Uncharacterised protein [Vibrio cholerae]